MSPQPIVFTEGPLRRLILEELRVDGPQWRTPETFDKGQALWEAVCEHVVAKRQSGRYVSGERGSVKVKNREYWRYELERESAINKRPQRVFV